MPPESTLARRTYIDWARGLAVLIMIEAHVADAWTRRADRTSLAFSWAMILGGFAAPLFLWLAGMGTTLSGARLARGANGRKAALEKICRRGLEIFILAFLFRLQAFVVSPGSYLVTLFRVDILNIMGPAIVATGLLWAITDRLSSLTIWYSVGATAIAMATPLVRTAPVVDLLPLWVQWYVRPAGDYTTFTAFPWAGFVFAGAACGALLSTAHDAREERRLQLSLAAAGLALVALGFYTAARPSIYAHSSFWSSSPTWFAIRVGIMMAGLAAVYAVSLAAGPLGLTCRPLERFGRSSLFVYWIHVELVYGYFSWRWRGRLPMWGTCLAFSAFSLLMYGAVIAKDRFVRRHRAREAGAQADSRGVGRPVETMVK